MPSHGGDHPSPSPGAASGRGAHGKSLSSGLVTGQSFRNERGQSFRNPHGSRTPDRLQARVIPTALERLVLDGVSSAGRRDTVRKTAAPFRHEEGGATPKRHIKAPNAALTRHLFRTCVWGAMSPGWGARASLRLGRLGRRVHGRSRKLGTLRSRPPKPRAWHSSCTPLRAMAFLRVGRLRNRWWVRGAVIAVALLVLATGLCLFDQDDHGADGRVLDLCLGIVAISLAIAPFAGLLAAGWAVNVPVAAPYAIALHVPDPPPRPAFLL